MAIHPQALTQITNFIPKADFCRMKCIARILHHFGHGNRRSFHGRFYRVIELCHDIATPLILLANDRKGWIIKIIDGCRFTHEFRVHAQTEVSACFLRRFFLQQRQHEVFNRARKHRTTNGNHMVAFRAFQHVTDSLNYTG